MVSQLNVFAIYTSEDIAVMRQLVKRLNSFDKGASISIWSENPILPEQAWKPQDESRFEQTDIFLLLVSDAFMHSQFIQQLEFKMVIDQYKAGKSTVIPVIIDKCPWDIDFRSDDYNFNLNELGVLPDKGKPIKEWESAEQVYNNIAKEINTVIASLSGNDLPEEIKENEEEKLPNIEEEQIAIPFDEEKEAQEAKRLKEIEAKRIAEENKARAEVEAKQQAAEQQKLHEEAEAKRRAEEARRLEEVASKQKAEEQKLKAEAESKKIEEKKKEAVEAQKQAEQKRRIAEETRKELVADANKTIEETQPEKESGYKKKLLIGALVSLIAIFAIWKFSSSPDKELDALPSSKATEVEDSIPLDKTEIDPVVQEESVAELAIGDFYAEGMVFAVDADSKNGVIVHMKDAGPMTWENAMQIHEQLGEGWRLPTLDELVILYKTVGQGAANNAEFSNGLYWSATDYDQYQARLLRMRDGNRSYHYNKVAPHRKYRVRAIRDFSQ